jgi:hypothetical protein
MGVRLEETSRPDHRHGRSIEGRISEITYHCQEHDGMSMQYTTCHEDTPCRGAGDMMEAQIHEEDTDGVSMLCWGLCTYWSGTTVPY